MALPTINTFSLDEGNIELFWKASPNSNIKKWNLYGSPSTLINFIPPNSGLVLPGSFTKIWSGISNSANAITPGSVYLKIPRTLMGIDKYDPYYFLLTSIDENNVESALEVDNLHSVPYGDDYYVDEAGQPVNIVYRNFEFDLWPMSGWDVNRYLNVTTLLGRPAKEIKIDATGSDVWVKFNAFGNDARSIRGSIPNDFHLIRGELFVEKIYFNNSTNNDATVRVFVAG